MTDLFKTAPAETLRYFRTKKSEPSFDWDEKLYNWVDLGRKNGGGCEV